MNQENKKNLPKSSNPGFRERLTSYLTQHHHIARAMFIASALVFFLALLPASIRNALLRGLKDHPYLSGMLFFFSLLSLSLLWSAGQRIDAWIFFYFNIRGKRPQWLDGIMLGFTQIGSGLFGMVVALISFFIDNHRLAYELILGTLTLWLVVELVKAIVHRSRPFIKLTETRIVGPPPKGLSFPSGHTSQVFFMMTLIIQHFHVSFWAEVLVLYALAVMVAVTRMYLGAHYPRDVMAGAMMGGIWGILGIIVDSHFPGGS